MNSVNLNLQDYLTLVNFGLCWPKCDETFCYTNIDTSAQSKCFQFSFIEWNQQLSQVDIVIKEKIQILVNKKIVIVRMLYLIVKDKYNNKKIYKIKEC